MGVLLTKDNNGFWELGPLPNVRAVQVSEMGKALCNCLTQQWSMLISVFC
jgi:hypothetical protein